MGRRPSEAQDKFIIRLPDGMRDQLKDAAEANDRTMTAEVVYRLRESFDKEVAKNEPEHASSLFAETVEREFETLREQVRALVDVQHNLLEEMRKREPKA
ncbi:MAG: Arc family DNA-binding protein [Albidovulum sp.]